MDFDVLRDIHEVVGRAVRRGEEWQAPVAVSVVDGGGHLLAFLRHGRARLISCTTATGKARCAVLFSRDSAETARIAAANPIAFQSFAAAGDTEFVIGDGGYFLESGGLRIGAGVAGANAELDERVGMFLREALARAIGTS